MKVVFGKGFTRRGKQHLNSSFILTKDFEGKRNANSDANRLRSTQNENDRNNDGVSSLSVRNHRGEAKTQTLSQVLEIPSL